MKVAIYGGSFNPPHVGHTMVAAWVLATADIDELWLVPCAEHAFSKDLCSFEHRMQMCRLAVDVLKDDRVRVSDVEGQLGGTSRTIDTIGYLRSQHPGWSFDLVVGTDIFAERASWKRLDELERLCGFIVVGRSGHPAPEGHPASPPIIDVSSTQVRRGLAAGGDMTALVPRRTLEYIDERGLYAP